MTQALLRNVLNPVALRSKLQGAVLQGILQDSFRRALNRAGVSTAGLGLTPLWREAVGELANSNFLGSRDIRAVPKPNNGLLPRPFKAPFRNRYVVSVSYRLPGSPDISSIEFSVYSNTNLTKGQAQRLALAQAPGNLSSGRYHDKTDQPELLGADLINGFYNVGIE